MPVSLARCLPSSLFLFLRLILLIVHVFLLLVSFSSPFHCLYSFSHLSPCLPFPPSSFPPQRGNRERTTAPPPTPVQIGVAAPSYSFFFILFFPLIHILLLTSRFPYSLPPLPNLLFCIFLLLVNFLPSLNGRT